MGKDLKVLANNRKNILLAELAAWLHDWRKCSDEHLQIQSKKPPKGAQGLSRDAIKNKFGINISLSILSDNESFIDLLKWDHKKTRNTFTFIGKYLVRGHHTAHFDKQEPEDGKQDYSHTFISTPFGYEFKTVPQNLTSQMFSLSCWKSLEQGNIIDAWSSKKEIRKLFSECLADTRRPINEITLWSWGHTVGALYKSSLAGALLGFKPSYKDLRWRLLSIRVNGLGFLLGVSNIPDLLARKDLLTQTFNKIQEIMELTYPIGTEVYRDENGSIFIVPGCDKTNCSLDILKIKNGYKSLEEHVVEIFANNINGEIIPKIKIDSKPWWGQDPDWQNKIKQGLLPKDELPPIQNHLQPVISSPAPDGIYRRWTLLVEEICSVCGLRPQDPSQKAKDRKVCDICEQRRSFRSKEWAEKRNTTIWIDEVADKNGRAALIIGKFDLTHWLDGTLVRSLAVRTPNDQNRHTTDDVAKNPSFARLRRIWETTRNFWEKVIKDTEENTKVNRRLYLDVEIESGELGPYHAYEIILKGVKIPVLWDSNEGRLWIIDSLLYLASRWNMDLKDRSFDETFNEVKSEFERLKDGTLKIYDPGGYGKEGRQVAAVRVKGVEEDSADYPQVIPILTEPQVFMALIPADRAMEVVENIKTKYEQEMGKVRNRLPLHLGVVFAHRMMPLRAILDAGKRMLEQKSHPLMWQVVCVARKQIDKGDRLPERFDADQNGQFKEWYEITLKNGKQLIWYVPALMGDGQTEDNWYPYVFLASPDEPTGRGRYYETENPWDPTHNHKWLVHAGDLEPGDEVYFTPATFDFLFLESNVKRQDVVYDNNGRRIMDRRKPYFLDEVEDLQRAWNLFSENLTSSQIYQMIDFIETTRENWFRYGEGNIWERSKDDGTFKEFCRSVIVNAEWENKPEDRDIENLTDWAMSGLLTDAFTLHHRMMKEEVKRDQEQKTT